MRLSPFRYYCDMIFEVMRNGKKIFLQSKLNMLLNYVAIIFYCWSDFAYQSLCLQSNLMTASQILVLQMPCVLQELEEMNLLISWTNADLRYWIGLLICLDIHMDVCLDLRLSSLLSSFSMEQTAFLPIIYSSGAIQKIMWKLNKSIAKELLPTQPVDFAIEPWWGVCLVNFTLEEFKVRSF